MTYCGDFKEMTEFYQCPNWLLWESWSSCYRNDSKFLGQALRFQQFFVFTRLRSLKYN